MVIFKMAEFNNLMMLSSFLSNNPVNMPPAHPDTSISMMEKTTGSVNNEGFTRGWF